MTVVRGNVFLYHWKDEYQHVVLDELELKRHDATLSRQERDRAVDDFIALVAAVDGILRMQAKADGDYFAANCGGTVDSREADGLATQFLKAYRWQYIFSGATHPRFQKIMKGLDHRAPVRTRRCRARHAQLALGAVLVRCYRERVMRF